MGPCLHTDNIFWLTRNCCFDGLILSPGPKVLGAPEPQAPGGPGPKPLQPGPKPLRPFLCAVLAAEFELILSRQKVEHADQGAHARLSSRIGHVCNNNAVLVLHSPGNMASCADGFPTQQLKTVKLLSPGSLALTDLVALFGLVPAAENPQGLGFRLSRFLRLWVGGLSRRLLSPAWPSWSSADARLAKLCL